MEDSRIDLFATGKYLDEIVLDAGAAKFAERIRRPRFAKRRYPDGGAAATRHSSLASLAPVRN
jgi:hypothetical protein